MACTLDCGWLKYKTSHWMQKYYAFECDLLIPDSRTAFSHVDVASWLNSKQSITSIPFLVVVRPVISCPPSFIYFKTL